MKNQIQYYGTALLAILKIQTLLIGTKEILEIVANKKSKDKIYAVAGGGETVAVINKFDKLDSFDFVSTAGGAFLEYLEGKELPGIRALGLICLN